MNHEEMTAYLAGRDVKATSNRLLVLGVLAAAGHPVSLAEIETRLDTVDKTSIFRVLELFVAKDLVHVIDDGSRSFKYELCHSAPDHEHDDEHVHFVCERCHRVVCLPETAVPPVPLPDGFRPHSVNYVIKGVCPDCSKE